MTSLQTSTRQVTTNSGYFIPVASCMNKIYNINNGSVAFAQFASTGTTSVYSTLVNAAGAGILRDMGKTVVSSSRTFRKVQLVAPTTSTFGVGGAAGTTFPASDWLTGYIELGFGSDGLSTPTPVAQYGRYTV